MIRRNARPLNWNAHVVSTKKNQPQYAVIAETLINDIAQQKYPVGTLLPPELEMAADFGVSRNTMRSALRTLVDMGLVSRRAGRGTLVQARRIEPNFTQVIESPDDLMPDVAGTEQTVVSSQEVTADEETALVLAADQGSRWNCMLVLRQRKTQPVSAAYVYTPPEARNLKTRLNKLKRASYKAVEGATRRKVAEVTAQADAVALPDRIAKLLKVPAGSPGLRTVRRYADDEGNIMLVTDSYSAPGRQHHTAHFRMHK